MMGAAAPNVPARPPRDLRLDIVRGWLQMTIFIAHAGTTWLQDFLVYGTWGLSNSAEQFVFLSGFTLGSVFALRTARQGFGAAARDMLRRTFRLYRTHLLVMVLFGALVIGADRSWLVPGEIASFDWGLLLADPLHAVPAALAMVYTPRLMDILPTFVWCMLLLPGFAALLGWCGDVAMLVPVAVYAAVWTFGLQPPTFGLDVGTGFNPFAWQVLFMLGAWLGRRALLAGRGLPPSRIATVLAIAVLFVGLALRLDWRGVLPWGAPAETTAWLFDRRDVALPCLLHAFALAWLVSRVVPREAAWMHRAPFRPLAAAGRHSLEVFCFGLFLSWCAATALRFSGGPWWLEVPVVAAGCAALFVQAAWLEQPRASASGISVASRPR
jgi:hypothetical protein